MFYLILFGFNLLKVKNKQILIYLWRMNEKSFFSLTANNFYAQGIFLSINHDGKLQFFFKFVIFDDETLIFGGLLQFTFLKLFFFCFSMGKLVFANTVKCWEKISQKQNLLACQFSLHCRPKFSSLDKIYPFFFLTYLLCIYLFFL